MQARPQLGSLRSIQYRTRHKLNICMKILLHDSGQTVVFMQHWLRIYCSSIDVAIALLYILYSYFRCIIHDTSPELTLPDLWIQKNSHKMYIVACNQLHSTGPAIIYIYVYLEQVLRPVHPRPRMIVRGIGTHPSMLTHIQTHTLKHLTVWLCTAIAVQIWSHCSHSTGWQNYLLHWS